MTTPRRKTTRVSRARLVAYEVLRDVADKDAYANLALQGALRTAQLSEQDAAFATELVSGTLRMSGRYDAIIEKVSGRTLSTIDPAVHTVLQLGCHQLLALDTATHAALNEQVELAKKVAGARTAGFVNGVLRTVSRSSLDEWLDRIAAGTASELAALALTTSHPEWICRAIEHALAADGHAADLGAALTANNDAPRVHLAVLRGGTAEDAAARGSGLTAEGVSPLGMVLQEGNPARVIAELQRAGILVKVQDQGSQLAALALTRSTPIVAGERWLDLCAGPGGKTAVLAAEAEPHGVSVRANEVSTHRAGLVRDSVSGFAETVTVVSHDGRTDEAFGETTYDRILVDAPCTGLGALRRRPEARWRKQPADVNDLVALQSELLEAATKHLAPGGTIAYVTCSPHLSETREVVDSHLSRHSQLRELDTGEILETVARRPLGGEHPRGGQRSVQLWPHLDNTDAMFIALLQHRGTQLEP